MIRKVVKKFSTFQPFRTFLQNIWLAIGLVWESDWRYSVANIALIVVQAIVPLFLLYVIKSIVDTIVEIDSASASSISDPAFRTIVILFAIGAALAITQNIVTAATRYVRFVQAMKVTDHVRSMLQVKAMEADLALFETPEHRDALYRTRQEAVHRPRTIVESLLKMAGEACSFLVMAGVLVSLHWIVLPALLLAAIPGIIPRLKIASGQYSWERDATQRDRYGNYVDRLVTSPENSKEVRGFSLGRLLREQYLEIREDFRKKRQAHAKRRAFVDGLNGSLIILVVFGMLAVIGQLAVSGTITAGEFVIFFAAMQRALTHIRQIFESFTSLFEDTLFIADFRDTMALQPAIVDIPDPRPLPPVGELDIRFDHVSFSYAPSEKTVLSDISFSIRSGETVAFVGPNGSGKTTLIKLMCRLYDPVEGTVSLGGTDLRLLRLSDLRRQFSYAFQDFSRYQMSAHDNIWLGDHAHLTGCDAVETAARMSGADRIVDTFPDGYQSTLGHEFVGGQELSGGQWQRFALARCFVREAPILLLDEPLSAVDAVGEEYVLDVLKKFGKHHTVITISHRLSAVRHVDRIFVLNEGRIVESGTHTELMGGGGLYARMFEAQAENYQKG